MILDEAALRRVAGGRAVTAAQLAKIQEITKRPNVAVPVLPFTAGSHPGLESYREIFCKLQSMALYLQDAGDLIAGIVRSYKDG